MTTPPGAPGAAAGGAPGAIDAVVALGSSLGPSARTLRLAIAMFAATPGIFRVIPSRIFLTPPAGGVARRPFLNAAARLHTALTPLALLHRCRQIEARLGRQPTRRWADRVIDLDILLFADTTLQTVELTLPHPRMHVRPFQLLPLLDCWPDVPGPWRALASGMRPLPVVGALPPSRHLPRSSGSAILPGC